MCTKGVKSVVTLPNGDVVCGGGDGSVKVFHSHITHTLNTHIKYTHTHMKYTHHTHTHTHTHTPLPTKTGVNRL